MPSFKEVKPGQQYGSYTVLNEPSKEGKYYKVNLQCSCGKITKSATADLNRFIGSVCRKCLANNLRTYSVGTIHGSLTILELLLNPKNHDKHKLKLSCSCGNIYIASVKSFKESKCCSLCSKRRIGTNHPSFKGVGKVSKTYFTGLKDGALKRGLEFSITLEQMSDLLEQQKECCAITNLPIKADTSKRRIELRKNNTASLDRINSDKGYTIDNVQWVHKDINFMKQQFSMEYFVEMCQKVVNHSNHLTQEKS
jgi:hypothetical protein